MLSRAGVVVTLAAVACAGMATPALARDPWAFTDCQQNPYPGCELGAGRSGGGATPQPGTDGPLPDADHSRPPGGTGTDEEPKRGDTIVDEGNVAHCEYERSDYQLPPDVAQPVLHARRLGGGGALVARPAAYRPARSGGVPAAPVAAPPGEGSGAWYVYRCSTPGVRDALYRPPVWIPDAAPGGPVPSAAELAAQARSQLRLPSLRIATNPAGDHLVRLPSWLWVDAAGWGQVAATAAAGGVSVTAVARPVQVRWAMGDGGAVTCAGPGTPFLPGGEPDRASPDCGYTYGTSSADRPGGVFTVTATVGWEVTWAGAGQSGAFPGLATTSATQVRVITVNVLANGGG